MRPHTSDYGSRGLRSPHHDDNTASAMRIEWSDAYLIGDPEIDAQHRAIFAAGNRVLAHDPSRLDAIALFDDLDELRRLVEVNFAHEEKLMRQRGTPADVAHHHRRQHAKIRRQMKQVFEESDTFDDLLCLTRRLMGKWLPAHTRDVDRQLVAAGR